MSWWGKAGFRKLLSFAALGLLCAGCAREKDVLDEQVRVLCAQDGGVKVYERIQLPAEQFTEFNEVRILPKELASPNSDFYYEHETKYYKKGSPEMWRTHFKLIRRGDGKLVAESVSYSRRGGDFIGPWHDSSFGCPENADIKYVGLATFYK